MFSFGEFYSLQGEKSNYSVWELSLFMLIGSMGGLIGACFNSFNLQLFQWRNRNLKKRPIIWRLFEALGVVIVMSLFAFLLPLLWTKCTPLPVDMEGWSDQEKILVKELVSMYCQKDSQYNELASLYLTG
jgi:chloride channel 7